jgi:helix-turn-helix protein
MSWRATAHVRELTVAPTGAKFTHSEKLIAFILADYHNAEKNHAWPSVKNIARWAMLSIRQTRKLLHGLEHKGVISIRLRLRADGSNASNAYDFPGLQSAPTADAGIPEATNAAEGEPIASPGDAQDAAPHEPILRSQVKGEESPWRNGPNPPEGTAGGHRHQTRRHKRAVSPTTANVSDRRFDAVVAHISAAYLHANDVPCPWDRASERAVQRMLQRLQEWPEDKLLYAIESRFASDLNTAESPRKWLSDLENYANGPLNKFKQPQGAERVKTRTEEINERNWRIAEEILDRANDYRASRALPSGALESSD